MAIQVKRDSLTEEQLKSLLEIQSIKVIDVQEGHETKFKKLVLDRDVKLN